MGKKGKQAKNGKKSGGSEDKSIAEHVLGKKKNGKQNKKKGKHDYDIDDDDKQFRKSLEADGRYTINEMDADGNCLFRALSDQLFHDYGAKHTDIRSAVCSFIEKNEEEFSGFLVLDENEEDEDAKDFETYVSNMRQDGEWGGNLELVAFSRLFRRNIMVFSAPLSAFTINHGGEESSGENLHLSYHDNLHYSSVRDNQSSQKPSKPDKVFSNLQDLTTPIANGAKPDSKVENDNNKDSELLNEDENENPAEVHPEPSAASENKPQPGITPKKGKIKKGDPCPCGSGQKYKKCCFAKEKHAERLQKIKNKDGLDGGGEHTDGEEENAPSFEMNGKFRVLQI